MTPRRTTLPLYWLVPTLALAILAFGFAFTAMADHRHDAETQRQVQALTLARHAALHYRLALNGAYNRLSILARMQETLESSPSACKEAFAAAMEEQPGFTGIAMLDPTGRPVCSLPPQPRTLSDQPWFRQALIGRKPVHGNVQWNSLAGPAASVAALPSLTPAGTMAAVLAATIDLSWLNEQIGSGLPADAAITVVDAGGVILARYPNAQSQLGKPLTDLPVTAAMLDGGEGSIEDRDATGARYVFGFVPRPGGGMIIAALPPVIGSAWESPAVPAAVGTGLLLLVAAFLTFRQLPQPDAAAAAQPQPVEDVQTLMHSNRMLTAEIAIRRQTEQALRDSETRFRLALSIAPIMVFTQDRALNYTWLCSPNLGYQPPDYLGQTDYALFERDSAELLEHLKRRVMESGAAIRTEIRLHFKPPHKACVFDLKLKPARDDNNQIYGILGVAVDITASHQAKEAMREARRQAEQANAAKSRFLAAANHDLRQPFQAIQLFHAVLAARITDTATLSVLEKMGQAMAAGEALLGALLDVSALDAGLAQPKIGDVPAASLLERLYTRHQPAAVAKGLYLRRHPCMMTLRSDAALLERLLDKIIANAVRHTASGSVLIACRRRDGMARFEVWDSGPGIPSGQLHAIFEDFFQLGNPERDRAKGLGLGLSVARRIAQLLDHPVAVRSRPGRGTVFTVIIPLAEAACERMPAPADRRQ